MQDDARSRHLVPGGVNGGRPTAGKEIDAMVAERNLGKTVALVELRHQGHKKVMSLFPGEGEIGKPVKAAVLLSAEG